MNNFPNEQYDLSYHDISQHNAFINRVQFGENVELPQYHDNVLL